LKQGAHILHNRRGIRISERTQGFIPHGLTNGRKLEIMHHLGLPASTSMGEIRVCVLVVA